jgi:hypothetical protein
LAGQKRVSKGHLQVETENYGNAEETEKSGWKYGTCREVGVIAAESYAATECLTIC